MGANVKFYLTHVLENSSRLDRWADTCLSPLHSLLRTAWGDKTVRVFRIESSKVVTVGWSESGGTALRIAKFIFNFVFFIPGTLVGVVFKALALMDENVVQQHQKIRKSVAFFDQLKNPEERQLVPHLPNDVFTNHLVPFFTPNEMLKAEEVSKGFYRLLNSAEGNRGVLANYRKNFRGIERVGPTTTPSSLSAAAIKHAQQYGYKGIAEIFGGIEQVLKLPLFKLEGASVGYEEVERFAHSEDFRTKPPLFRLSLNWGRKPTELIIIKYSLFIPMEAQEADDATDFFWHDYLILTSPLESRDPESVGYRGWNCIDPRQNDHLPHQLRRNLGFRNCPISNEGTLFSFFDIASGSEETRNLRNFLNGKLALLHFRFPTPWYIFKKERQQNPFSPPSQDRIFKAIPAFFGHVDLAFDQVFTRPEDQPHFYADADGNIRSNEKAKIKALTVKNIRVCPRTGNITQA